MIWYSWYNFVIGGIVAAIMIYVDRQRSNRLAMKNHFGRPTRIKSGAASRRIKPDSKLAIFLLLVFWCAIGVAAAIIIIRYQIFIELRFYCCGDKPN